MYGDIRTNTCAETKNVLQINNRLDNIFGYYV